MKGWQATVFSFLLGAAVATAIAIFLVPHQQGASACGEGASEMARVELLFGTSRADAVPVSLPEWNAFLDAEVTPRFPDGLTVLNGAGQWRAGNGTIVEEDSIVLLIWYEPSEISDADIDAIREAYKAHFGQESVMRVDGSDCVSF